MAHRRVTFKTVDNVTLAGDFFPAAGAGDAKRPIVIMTQGLSLLKEHYIPDWASHFQRSGFHCLLYDHRGWGSSSGSPNTIDPLQQAEDYHDAVLYARTLPGVDPNKIVIWGIGHSGGASMIAAGDDPNICAVILVMPFISGKIDTGFYPPGLVGKAWQERAGIVSGTSTAAEAKYVQVWDSTASEAQGERGEIMIHGSGPYDFIAEAQRRSNAAGTPWQNKLSLQSLYRISKTEPGDYIHKIAPRKLLYLAAIEDPLSGPYEAQQAVFAKAGEPKTFVTLETDHVSNYFGDWFERHIKVQVDFLKSL